MQNPNCARCDNAPAKVPTNETLKFQIAPVVVEVTFRQAGENRFCFICWKKILEESIAIFEKRKTL